jgi:hypothetical protein
MMTPATTLLQDTDFLLRLLRKETQEQVKAALMDVAEDVVNEVARKATEALGMRIQTVLDEASSRFLVKVILEKKEP